MSVIPGTGLSWGSHRYQPARIRCMVQQWSFYRLAGLLDAVDGVDFDF